MMNDECDSASNRALILKKTVEQAIPAEATECDQTTTKCKNYGRQVGQRKISSFLLQIFYSSPATWKMTKAVIEYAKWTTRGQRLPSAQNLVQYIPYLFD